MIEQDTIKLLRECDAGTKMGISSISDVIDKISDESMRGILEECKREHERLEGELAEQLAKYRDDGKDPNPIAKGMSYFKTNLKLGIDYSDSTIAELMSDGASMGSKTISRYLNEYKAADEFSKDIAKRLISIEDTLAANIRGFL